MKKNIVPLLGIAFVVAIASTGIFYGLFVGKLRSATDNPGGTHPVVIAAHSLKTGTVISAPDVKIAAWPGDAPKGSYGASEKVIGLTILQPIEEGELIHQARVASPDANSGSGLGIPSGMRAVSIHVTDSTGVVAVLRPGHKVDVQLVAGRPTDDKVTQVLTVLQDLRVLAVNSQPETASQGRFSAPVVTLLAKPEDADVLALADSAARARLVLRNPLDDEKSSRRGVTLETIFRGGYQTVTAAARIGSGDAARPEQNVALSVQVVGVTKGALDDLGRELVAPLRSDRLQVSEFRPGSDVQGLVHRLQEGHSLDVLEVSQLVAGMNRPASLQTASRSRSSSAAARGTAAAKAAEPEGATKSGDDTECGLRIQFSPFRAANGQIGLRLQPEVTAPMGDRTGVRRVDTEIVLFNGQGFLLTGLVGAKERPLLLERLFGDRGAQIADRDLAVVVVPRFTEPAQAAGLRKR